MGTPSGADLFAPREAGRSSPPPRGLTDPPVRLGPAQAGSPSQGREVCGSSPPHRIPARQVMGQEGGAAQSQQWGQDAAGGPAGGRSPRLEGSPWAGSAQWRLVGQLHALTRAASKSSASSWQPQAGAALPGTKGAVSDTQPGLEWPTRRPRRRVLPALQGLGPSETRRGGRAGGCQQVEGNRRLAGELAPPPPMEAGRRGWQV